MLFNTVHFALFYSIVVLLYFVLPHRFRCWFLLAASYYFYMCWSIRYILLILAITLIDFLAGIRIEQARGSWRRFYLALSMVCNFGLLFVFKYADLFSPAKLHWLLPVGISFHTFQAVSYTFDVYRGKVRAERDIGIYALYVAFFPQMVAGPIERPGHLLPQFHTPRGPEYGRITSGLRLALWGLIKKTVVADLAAPVVNTVYARPRNFPGSMLSLATLLFAVQIYCDFSGYSDMAVGTARVLGYDLTINFRQPWLAKSIAEFWGRWHISLSTWFRDYLYIPLGGNRVSLPRWSLNILLVFLISGLWHGANWTFVAWGGLHAGYVLTGAWTQKWRARIAGLCGLDQFPYLHTLVRLGITNGLTTFGWIFFRSRNLSDAMYITSHLLKPGALATENVFRLGLPRFEMAFLLTCIPMVFACEYVRERGPAWFEAVWQKRPVRWGFYATAVYGVVFFGVFTGVEFVYFQF